MSTKKKMLWLLSLLPFFIACGDDNTDIPDWPWAEPETPTEPVEANPDIVNLGWVPSPRSIETSFSAALQAAYR